jgi:hypothetical protein
VDEKVPNPVDELAGAVCLVDLNATPRHLVHVDLDALEAQAAAEESAQEEEPTTTPNTTITNHRKRKHPTDL